MKVGIAACMWRGLADLPYPEFVDYCKKVNADVIEISGWPKSYGEGLVLDDAGVEMARSLANRAGIDIWAIGVGDDLVQATPEAFEDQINLIKHYVDLAVKLGSRVASLKVGTPKEGIPQEDALKMIIDGLKRVAPYAQERGVFLALENRTSLSGNPDNMLKIIKDVRSLFVRALIDTGNYMKSGYGPDDVVKVVEQLAPYTVHSHLKNGRGTKKEYKDAPLDQGDLDIDRILRVLQINGYLNPICVQYEGPDQPALYGGEVKYIRDRVANWETGSSEKTPLVRGFHHYSLATKDFQTAYEFYGELLGLPMVSAQGWSYAPVLMFQLPTGEQLHVHLHGPSTACHVAIEVADFGEALARLTKAGIEIIHTPDKRGDGSDFLFCLDPHGNKIEITHHYSWAGGTLLGKG